MKKIEGNKELLFSLVVVTIIVTLIGCFFAYKNATYDKGATSGQANSNTKDENIVETSNQNDYSDEEYEIVLDEAQKSVDYRDLHLDFERLENEEYKYILNIKAGEKEVDSSFYGNKDNVRIVAYANNPQFNVYKRGNIYILVSNRIGAQCNPNSVMIINKEGEVLKTISSGEFQINSNYIKVLEDTTQSGCSTSAQPREVHLYKASENELTEISDYQEPTINSLTIENFSIDMNSSSTKLNGTGKIDLTIDDSKYDGVMFSGYCDNYTIIAPADGKELFNSGQSDFSFSEMANTEISDTQLKNCVINEMQVYKDGIVIDKIKVYYYK